MGGVQLLLSTLTSLREVTCLEAGYILLPWNGGVGGGSVGLRNQVYAGKLPGGYKTNLLSCPCLPSFPGLLGGLVLLNGGEGERRGIANPETSCSIPPKNLLLGKEQGNPLILRYNKS